LQTPGDRDYVASMSQPHEGEGREPPGGEADERDDTKMRRRIEQLVPDLVKRTFYAGLGALFTTEEGIRKITSEFQLPKDVAAFLVAQVASSKDEMMRIVARELRSFLDGVNLSGEMQKLLTSLSFEIKTEIRFIPNDEKVGGLKSTIKNEVGVRRSRREHERLDERKKDPPEEG
jgi:hypothetical protein